MNIYYSIIKMISLSPLFDPIVGIIPEFNVLTTVALLHSFSRFKVFFKLIFQFGKILREFFAGNNTFYCIFDAMN